MENHDCSNFLAAGKLAPIAGVCLALSGCFADRTVPIEAEPRRSASNRSPAEQLQQLVAAAPPGSEAHDLTSDVRAILGASIAKTSSGAWLAALKTADGRLARVSLEGWAESLSTQARGRLRRSFMLRLLLEQVPETVLRKKLNRPRRPLEDLLGDHAEPPGGEPGPLGLMPPSTPGVPGDDPVLRSLVKRYCAAPSVVTYQWEAWVATLHPHVREYWRLKSRCTVAGGDEADALLRLADAMKGNPATAPLALTSLQEAVRILRRTGRREEAATIYDRIAATWNLPGITPSALGVNDERFRLQHIDDHLWAARYKGLVGDLEVAARYAEKGRSLIEAARPHIREEREDLALFHAESLYIEAFRIALERKDYGEVVARADEALSDALPDKVWRSRFLWAKGLALILARRFAPAREALEKMAAIVDPGDIAKPLFWLAYCDRALGETERARERLARLVRARPLSFYALVAAKEEGWTVSHPVMTMVRTPQKGIKLDLRLGPLLTDSALRRGLRKTEVLAAAGLTQWSRLTGLDLYDRARRQISFSRDFEASVYLALLLNAAEAYKRSLGLIATLAGRTRFWEEWAEMAFAFFPRPYAETYRQAATGKASRALLYAITRQESGFDRRARSGAHAIGLMQLIVPTAQRISDTMGGAGEITVKDLQDPHTNILLGSRYLHILVSRYQGFLPAALAAYNAGEYAVDRWLDARPHDNPLLWVEMIPFGETRRYVKKVWRNHAVYQALERHPGRVVVRTGRQEIVL